MHEKNIEALRDEAIRLINIEIAILEQMQTNEAGILAQAKTKKHYAVLEKAKEDLPITSPQNKCKGKGQRRNKKLKWA